MGEKKASRMGAERWRRAGNGAPLFFFIPQFFPQLGAIKQALRGLRCIFIAAAQRVGVYAQRDAGVGVAHARGDGHGVNVIRQQYGGMRMPQIVEAYPFKAVGIREAPEPLRRRVMVQLRAVPCGVSKAVIMLVVLLSVQMDGVIGGKIMLHHQRGAVYSGKLRAEGQGQRCGPVGRRRK